MSNSDSFTHSDLQAGFTLDYCFDSPSQKTPGVEGQQERFFSSFLQKAEMEVSASKPTFIKCKLQCSRLKLEFQSGTRPQYM